MTTDIASAWDTVISKYQKLARSKSYGEFGAQMEAVASELRFRPALYRVVPRTSMFSLVLSVPGRLNRVVMEWHGETNLFLTYIEIHNMTARHYFRYANREGIVAAVEEQLEIVRRNSVELWLDDLTFKRLETLAEREQRGVSALLHEAVERYLAEQDPTDSFAVRYVTVDELIYINEQLPAREQIHKILKGKQKVRDMSLLEAAAGRPMQSVFGRDAYPTVPLKAVALLHSIARNHPFADGNKRTATLGALFMLEVNGLRATWQPEKALERIIAIANGELSVEDFAAWLPTDSTEPTLMLDAHHDTQIIARLLTQHKWLLDELAER